MRKLGVLLIAFEMPPARSAGVQRPFRFAEYLLELGWDVHVLTATEDVYQRFDHELQVPSEIKNRIHRCRALDTNKLFSLFGRSPNFTSVPDRYWPWYFSAVNQGRTLLQETEIDVIWSTYPIMTSHLVGRKLSKLFGIPFVADFRDPLQCHYNPDYHHYNWLQLYLERKVIKQATKVVTTSSAAADLYRMLYTSESKGKFEVIENGFVPLSLPKANFPEKFTLLYSGALYGNGRDVSKLFSAMCQLKQQGVIHTGNFRLVFRGSAKGERFSEILEKFQITDLVEFLNAVPFVTAQEEMMSSSANLLIQDDIFKYQIPGKIYDYIQSRKPLLAICPVNSATADVCKRIPKIRRAWEQTEIANAIVELLNDKQSLELLPEDIISFSRFHRANELSSLLNNVISN